MSSALGPAFCNVINTTIKPTTHTPMIPTTGYIFDLRIGFHPANALPWTFRRKLLND
jgi:hypothetical protein